MDYSDAVTFALTLPQTDPDRIGAWGSSLSGGHVIVLAGQDRRVKAIVAQAPMVSGRECGQRLVPAPALAAAAAFQHEDRLARMAGKAPAMMPVASPDPTAPAALPTPDAWDFVHGQTRFPTYRNEVTPRTMELVFGYEPRPAHRAGQPDADADDRRKRRHGLPGRPPARGVRAGPGAEAAAHCRGRALRRVRGPSRLRAVGRGRHLLLPGAVAVAAGGGGPLRGERRPVGCRAR
ncbi:acetylxylan esterase [Streptomyces sp. TRM70350]|nr:acetylxylan esterase [Streptomyces sp. TRM70350]